MASEQRGPQTHFLVGICTQDPAVGRTSLQLGPPAHSVGVIPKEEMRNKYYTFVNHVSSLKGLSGLMNYSDSLTKVCGILARYIRASDCKDKRTINNQLSVRY